MNRDELLAAWCDVSNPGIIGIACAACGAPITVNRRAYNPDSGPLFCRACAQLGEEEIIEALNDRAAWLERIGYAANPEGWVKLIGYVSGPLPGEVIILGGEG